MDHFQPLPDPQRFRTTLRVRGPRPCSWISSSPSSSNEHRDIWNWTVQGSGMRRRGTLHSTTSSESSDYTISSSSSSPVTTPNSLVEFGEKANPRRTHRRKPAGPRPPRNSSSRPSLLITTSLPTTPQFRREFSATTPPRKNSAIVSLPSSQILPPPSAVSSPTNFLLDWDAIFKVLECSDIPPDSAESW